MNCPICNRKVQDVERHRWRIHHVGEWGRTHPDLDHKEDMAWLRKTRRELFKMADAITERTTLETSQREEGAEIAAEILVALHRLKSALAGSMDDEIQRLIDNDR